MAAARTAADALAALALGRIFRMGSRPTQPGDVEEYERCRAIIMDAAAGRLGVDGRRLDRRGGR